MLEPGTYTATFDAAGFQPKEVELKVEPGSESVRTIDLDPIPITVKPHIIEPEPEPAPPPPPQPSKLPLYIGAGATGVLLLTATITGISAISQHHAFTDPTFSESERKDAQSLGHTMEHVTDLCLVGMIARRRVHRLLVPVQVPPRPRRAASGTGAPGRAQGRRDSVGPT